MIEPRKIGLLCYKTNENFVFFVETIHDSFVHIVPFGDEVNLFLKHHHDLQMDLFLILGQEEAQNCHLALAKLSRPDRFKG